MKILMIDDDYSCLESLKNTLEPANHSCELFSNPKAAMDAFEQFDFHVVITDYRMPDMDGIEILRQVKMKRPEVKVIIMTGYSDERNTYEAETFGAFAFLHKPVNIVEVLDLLENIEKDSSDISL